MVNRSDQIRRLGVLRPVGEHQVFADSQPGEELGMLERPSQPVRGT